uniref:Putative oxydoreductase protein,zinc-containing (Quinone oxidoreductase, NADPH dependent) n=1 Tax=mine drainage metagenome TaxID=410659 RepID=E6QNF6_9ZZZZ
MALFDLNQMALVRLTWCQVTARARIDQAH